MVSVIFKRFWAVRQARKNDCRLCFLRGFPCRLKQPGIGCCSVGFIPPRSVNDSLQAGIPNRIKGGVHESWTVKYTVDEVVDLALAKEIPAGPIYNVKQIVEDEHISKVRKIFLDVDHPVIGKMKLYETFSHSSFQIS